jgi:polysaccharide biosynthesis protein PelA
LNKYRLVAAVSVVCLMIYLSSSIFAAYQAQAPLNNVSNYKIYYGEVNDQIIEGLKAYDLAIIEPHEFTKEQVEAINASGTITLGYMSIMELENWNESFVEKVLESDYYYKNNLEKVYIGKWDTYIMDISQPHFRQIILEEIEEEIMAKGFKGIFLDTVGDIDDYFHDQPREHKKLRDGYITLLKEIKKQNKEWLLVQNWGFDTYKQASKAYVNGVLWEGFSKDRIQHDKWSQKWIDYFHVEKSKGKLALFTVSPNANGSKYSRKLGFISYLNENDIYNEWFD